MILLTGGSGRLGSELQRLLPCVAPSSKEFDILNPRWPWDVDAVVHCAAYTDVLKAENERSLCYDLNVRGTRKMTKVPLVYISTEYVFAGRKGNYKESDKLSPVNFYAETKAIGEEEARQAPRSLVIRCIFKERPFRHPKAITDQFTSGDYVDVIAPMVASCVNWFMAGHFEKHDTIHVGTGRKSTYDLAKQTRDVEPIKLADVGMKLPRDTSLDCSRFYSMCQEYAHGY